MTRRLIEIELCMAVVAPAESETRIENRNVPRMVGVPVTLPDDAIPSPLGRAPSAISHL
jgi:hypothetical protein